ncbi:MAG: AAA family ATPase [Planctomycetota bacterium]
MSADDKIIQAIRMYRESLQQTQLLYIESGELIRGSYGWLSGKDDEDAATVSEQMDDLHRGLVMKVFSSVVPDANGQSMQQRQLGRVLLEHVWQQKVMGHQLREAVDWLIDAANGFEWSELIRPFAEIPAIRDRFGELESLAHRMAKLLASVDGEISIVDNQNLIAMRRQFESCQDNAPERLASDRDTQSARDALAWLRDEAKRLRDGSSIDAAQTPSPQPRSDRQLNKEAKDAKVKPTAEEAPDDRSPEERLKDARAKLDRLVGLDGIKDQIQTLTNFLRMEKLRSDQGLPTTRPSLHMAFVGNPGTGKTTVARIVAEIYGALGVLEKGHLVETDRSGLVAEYAGQTGPKTNAKIDEALDGVLFIDEAYTLIDESGQDQYGREAIQALLKRMEDQRDRLVVILAGYPVEMRQMIRSNPGLSSRVGTTMHFDDYPPAALGAIFELIAAKAKYELPPGARKKLLRGFTYLFVNRDRHFGNGRCSRNSFERSVRRLANRLAEVSDIDHAMLTTLEPEDIEIAGITQERLESLCESPGRVSVMCPQCQGVMSLDDDSLGREKDCVHCGAKFSPKWGEPVPVTTAHVDESEEL